MRKSIVCNVCLCLLIAPVFTACEPNYVDNNGVRYYDANDLSTDSLPSGPYTKNGLYYNNPSEATNTRDNRGNRVSGYGHDVNEDYRTPTTTTVVYPPGTVVYGDGTIVYPDGYTVAPGSVVAYPGTHTTTTTTTVIHTQ